MGADTRPRARARSAQPVAQRERGIVDRGLRHRSDAVDAAQSSRLCRLHRVGGIPEGQGSVRLALRARSGISGRRGEAGPTDARSSRPRVASAQLEGIYERSRAAPGSVSRSLGSQLGLRAADRRGIRTHRARDEADLRFAVRGLRGDRRTHGGVRHRHPRHQSGAQEHERPSERAHALATPPPQPSHRSGAPAPARRRGGVPVARPLSVDAVRSAPADGAGVPPRRVLVGARGQPEHQPARRRSRRDAVQDLSDLSEDARLKGSRYDRRVPTVAVTGASGFIGSNLTAHLSARGHDVRAVRRPFDRPDLIETLRGCEVVVHLAGVVAAARDDEYVAANVTATRVVAESTRAAGARLVHISSLAAAGPASRAAPRVEDDPPAPMTAYGRSKLAGERAIEGVRGLQWTILRPGVVYGPRDRAVLALFRMARAGMLPLVGRETAAYTMIHVADVVRAIEAAVDRGDASGETMFVGHPEPVSARALVEGVRDAAGGAATIVRVPRPLLWIAARAGDAIGALRGKPVVINRRRYDELNAEGFVCRVDRLRDRLGIVAEIALRDGLAQTANWYRSNGWL
ncbi:MAG: hypothetical protein DMG01_22615 [Acidobacteria bacterium]|nr:MAG: hypothetical protein DMG01_22615 [Acidobacteriota bacterium]